MNANAYGKDYEIDGFLKSWTDFAFGFLEEKVAKFLPDTIPLSVTAAAEHFTAIWAKNALTSPAFQNFKDESLRDLIMWHAVEEIEHKHVAFDILRNVDDRYSIRAFGMVLAAAIIAPLSFWGALYLLRQEKDIDWADYLQSLLNEIVDEEGMLRLYAEAFFQYFKPGFHPSQSDDYELAERISKDLEKRIAEAKAV